MAGTCQLSGLALASPLVRKTRPAASAPRRNPVDDHRARPAGALEDDDIAARPELGGRRRDGDDQRSDRDGGRHAAAADVEALERVEPGPDDESHQTQQDDPEGDPDDEPGRRRRQAAAWATERAVARQRWRRLGSRYVEYCGAHHIRLLGDVPVEGQRRRSALVGVVGVDGSFTPTLTQVSASGPSGGGQARRPTARSRGWDRRSRTPSGSWRCRRSRR